MINKKLDFIYNHFGNINQFDKLAEECAEYLKAYHKKDELNILDEAGDVYVVSAQLFQNNEVVRDTVEMKVNRTMDRIDSGFYGE